MVLLLNFPPRSRTSPDLSPQQICQPLFLTSLTGSTLKVVFPSNISQDLFSFSPPHTILLQSVWTNLALFRLPTGQVCWVTGLKISAAAESLLAPLYPPATMNPRWGDIIEWDHIRIYYIYCRYVIIPLILQGWVWHCLSWCWSPWHSVPPWAGAGLSQSLRLVSVPPPQLWEHWDQFSQDPQEPSMGPKGI